jgi:hypothetical protein
MADITELSNDLIEKLKTVPALQNRVGMATAGGPNDPSMQNVPMPAAWVLFEGFDVGNPDPYAGRGAEDVNYRFSAIIMVSYTNQSETINTALPTILACAQAVSGKESTNFALKWKSEGAQIIDVQPDRLVYELRFMVSASFLNT